MPESHTQDVLRRANDVLIGNYARLPVVMVRGQGPRVWDADGKEYLDLFAGFGAGILGHCHPELIAAVTEQAGKLWHVGNTFHTEPQTQFAKRLNKHAFKGRAFFCHSGLEANEAAVKLARLRGQQHSPGRWKVISMNRSFHGRSLAMIAATGNPAVKAGFGPAVPGFAQIDLGDTEALGAAADPEVAAIVFEPIQGEGGIYPALPEYAVEVRRLCDERGITLIFDEVWTGCGRTGRWFGYQHFRTASGEVVEPDILTLGKAVGGGLPVGVMFAKPAVADLLVPGRHGATLGGNPIAMASARTVFDVIERDDLTTNAAALGEHAMARLRNEKKIAAKIAGVRGRGLFIGVELKDVPQRFVERGLEKGVILNVTAQKVVRLAPPINIDRATLDKGLDRVIEVIAGS